MEENLMHLSFKTIILQFYALLFTCAADPITDWSVAWRNLFSNGNYEDMQSMFTEHVWAMPHDDGKKVGKKGRYFVITVCNETLELLKVKITFLL